MDKKLQPLFGVLVRNSISYVCYCYSQNLIIVLSPFIVYFKTIMPLDILRMWVMEHVLCL